MRFYVSPYETIISNANFAIYVLLFSSTTTLGFKEPPLRQPSLQGLQLAPCCAS